MSKYRAHSCPQRLASFLKKRFEALSPKLFQFSRRLTSGSHKFLRRTLEHKKTKTAFGVGLAMVVLLASVLTPAASALASVNQTETVTLSPGALELTTKESVRLPVNSLSVTQRFSFFHPGVDLDGVTGDPIYPMMAGTVESVIYDRFGLGKHVIINHGSGLKSVYGHLSKIEVNAGQKVDTNQRIGLMGNTGHSFGDHLHLEVYDNQQAINPLTIIPTTLAGTK